MPNNTELQMIIIWIVPITKMADNDFAYRQEDAEKRRRRHEAERQRRLRHAREEYIKKKQQKKEEQAQEWPSPRTALF